MDGKRPPPNDEELSFEQRGVTRLSLSQAIISYRRTLFSAMEMNHTVIDLTASYRNVEEESKELWEATTTNCSKDSGKLYERRSHQQYLVDAYQRCIQSSAKELVMINGPSGTGKTALANSFRAHVENEDQGIWIQGKFEQIHRAKPYASFLSALTQLVKAIEGRGSETTVKVKEALKSRMDPEDRQWLTSAVPSLRKLFSTSSDDGATNSGIAPILISGVVARNQFQRVVPIILAAICSAVNVPIVMFLDDLQWSDGPSLHLLRDLATDHETPSFMVLGACRGDEVGLDHPLSATLRQLEDKDNVKVTNIEISNLHVGAVQEFVSDALELPSLVVQPLADIIFRESEGNIFYMIRFMQILKESGFLYRDTASKQWTWDEEKIRPRYDDVLHLLSAALRKLPSHVQLVLQVAACLGAKFKEEHLQLVISSEVEPALASAEDKTIVVVDSDSGECSWVHDRWQQAAYNLITESSRSQFHLQIGRMLWNGLPAEGQGYENLFLIVNQILKGATLITDDEERQIACMLCLQAGEMAAKASAFEASAVYLNQGLGLLNRRHWRDQYELSLRLYNAAAEMEYCNGRFDKAILLIEEILMNARSFEDRLQAHTTQVYAIGTRGDVKMSVDVGLSVLKQLGVSFPRNPRLWHVAFAFLKTKQLLNGKSDSDVLNLPLVSDMCKVAAMNLMNLLFLYAKMTNWNLCALMAFQMVRTTVQDGLGGACCAPCFAFYGSILCWMGDVDEGFRFAQLSLKILKNYNTKEWIPRVAGTVFGVVLPWKAPLRECLPGLFDAYRISSQSGDFELATICGGLYSMAHLLCGHPLVQILPQMTSFYDQLKKMGHAEKALQSEVKIQLVRCLIDGGAMPSLNLGSAPQKGATVAVDLDKASRHNLFSIQLGFWKFVVAFFQGDYVLAYQIVKDFGSPRRMGPPFIYAALQTFSSVVCLSLPNPSRTKLRLVRRNQRTLRRWATHCPENFANKVLLIEAELARVACRADDEVMVKYDESILLAKKEGNLMEHALACERAGLYLRGVGKSSTAIAYFERSQRLYQEWGCVFKMDQQKSFARLEGMNLTPSQ